MGSRYSRSYDPNDPTSIRREINAGNRLQREDDRRLNDAAMKEMGGPVGHAPADQASFLSARRNDDPTTFRINTAQRRPPMAAVAPGSPRVPMDTPSPTSPRAAGTPTHLLPKQNYRSGGGRMLDPTQLDSSIAAGTARDRAGLAPGGMGTVSYTQNAQASAPMTPKFAGSGMPNVTRRGPVGVVTGTESAPVEGRRQFQDATQTGVTRTEVPIDPRYQTPGKPAVATGTIKQAGPNQWQHDIVSEHPNIGVAGHPENTEFVAAFKAAGGDPQKAMDIANQLRAQRQIASAPPAAAQVRSDITPAGPAAAGPPQKPQPISAVRAIGQAAALGRKSILGTPAKGAESVFEPVRRAAGTAKELFEGFLDPTDQRRR